jgi:hypothetical protein
MPDSKHLRWVDDYSTDAETKADESMDGNSIVNGYPKHLHLVDGALESIRRCTRGRAIETGPNR